MRVSLPSLPMITEFRTMEQRSRNWTPIQAQLRGIIIASMNGARTKTVKSSGDLDRSLSTLDVWRTDRLSVEWGSGLEYAASHDIYRKKKGLLEMLPYNLETEVRLTDALRDWIVKGRRS